MFSIPAGVSKEAGEAEGEVPERPCSRYGFAEGWMVVRMDCRPAA